MSTKIANASGDTAISPNVQPMSIPVIIYMRSQSSVIVVWNLIVLFILTVRKRQFPTVYWFQIACLAFNDVLAGVANLLISLTDLPYIKDSITNCSIVVAFSFSVQSASLYNILGICIHRFTVLKRRTTISNAWKNKHTLICTLFAWTLSLSLCSFPVLLYRKPEGYNATKFCSVQPLFGTDVKKGMLILMGSFIFPLIFTNVLYIISFCILKWSWKTVEPDISNANSEKGSLCSISGMLNEVSIKTKVTAIANLSVSSGETSPTAKTRHHWANISPSLYQEKRFESFNNGKENIKHFATLDRQQSVFLKIPEKQTNVKQLSVESIDDLTLSSSAPQLMSTQSINSSGWSPSYSSSKCKPLPQMRHNVPQTLKRQRKAYILIGIILLFLNIFTWPGVVAMALGSVIDTISVGRGTLLPLFTTIFINSLVNPILYTTTIPEFRSAILDLINSIYKLIKC